MFFWFAAFELPKHFIIQDVISTRWHRYRFRAGPQPIEDSLRLAYFAYELASNGAKKSSKWKRKKNNKLVKLYSEPPNSIWWRGAVHARYREAKALASKRTKKGTSDRYFFYSTLVGPPDNVLASLWSQRYDAACIGLASDYAWRRFAHSSFIWLQIVYLHYAEVNESNVRGTATMPQLIAENERSMDLLYDSLVEQKPLIERSKEIELVISGWACALLVAFAIFIYGTGWAEGPESLLTMIGVLVTIIIATASFRMSRLSKTSEQISDAAHGLDSENAV